MRRRASMIAIALVVAAGGVVMLSCGGSSSSPGARPTGNKTTPLHHVATAPTCAAWALSDYCPVSGGSCASGADCSGGLDGRCRLTVTPASPSGSCECQYEPCHTDSDCPDGTDCVCNPIAGGAGSSGNLPTACLPSNCHSDADCPSGFCSPSMVPGHCGPTTLGNYCHTAGDECNNDGDCVADADAVAAGNVASCVYSKELGRWACTASLSTGCGG